MCFACYLGGAAAAADAHNLEAAADGLLHFDGYRAASFFLALARVDNDFFALSGARALRVEAPPPPHRPPPPLCLQFHRGSPAHQKIWFHPGRPLIYCATGDNLTELFFVSRCKDFPLPQRFFLSALVFPATSVRPVTFNPVQLASRHKSFCLTALPENDFIVPPSPR